MELTPKQRVFVGEYLVDMNATQAAVRAGYSPAAAGSIGSRLMRNERIRREVERKMAERAERTRITQDRVLEEYARIAFMDPRKLFDPAGQPLDVHRLNAEEAAVLAGLEVVELYEGRGANREQVGYTRKYKLADKLKALDALGKHLGIFKAEKEEDDRELMVCAEMDDEMKEFAE